MEIQNTVKDLEARLNEISRNYQHLLQETHDKALLQNETQTNRWEDYKKDHKELCSQLLSLRDKLSFSVMVPIGKRALMRGHLVHTNEILVCLGDGWFAKQSAKQASDICHRRIKYCDEMLTKLKREKELLSSRKSFTLESEVFGCNQIKEIIEPYDEEEEKRWKEEHRKKERDYRHKLAELKKAQKIKIETEEDLWKKLDALDLQEEIEDEMNRLDMDVEDDDDSENENESDIEEISDREGKEMKNLKTLQRRVSFKEDMKNTETESSESKNENLIRITFKHSESTSTFPAEFGDKITNPSDIYIHYMRQKTLKSILKPSPTPQCTLPIAEGTSHHTEKNEKAVKQILEPNLKDLVEDPGLQFGPTVSNTMSEAPRWLAHLVMANG